MAKKPWESEKAPTTAAPTVAETKTDGTPVPPVVAPVIPQAPPAPELEPTLPAEDAGPTVVTPDLQQQAPLALTSLLGQGYTMAEAKARLGIE